jgi:hypothetical protein
MAVDKQTLTTYIEELGLSDQAKAALLADLEDEKRATNFVGQRLRHNDYTKKTMELATQKSAYEEQVGAQVAEYAKQLEVADEKMKQVLRDFEQESISRTTAESRLRSIKQKYALADEDIPDVTTPAKAGADAAKPAIDIQAELAKFRNDLLKELKQDMRALPTLAAIQADIGYNHQELFGKRLTLKEMDELVGEATKKGMTLEQAWESKYDVKETQFNKRLDSEVTKRMEAENKRREAEETSRRSEEALSSARNGRGREQFTADSTVLKHQFTRRDNDAPGLDPSKQTDGQPSNKTPEPAAQKMSGAERAAAKWIERAQSGQIGKPIAPAA